jgi:hypothetical protein
MKQYDTIGIQIPRVYLPRPGIDLNKWSVIACDQFTSQPEYWEKVIAIVGNAYSTLRLILPEVYLEAEDIPTRIQSIQQHMRNYLAEEILVPQESLIYVERSVSSKTRKGLMLALDLDKYEYKPGSKSLIRSTEGTIIERLPPRMKIRRGAVLEIPHILVLIDDPDNTVIEPLSQYKNRPGIKKLYDFDLMLSSGHLIGYAINDSKAEAGVISALQKLAVPQTFAAKYGTSLNTSVLLFAMGDGNHSLATAKAIWEEIKAQAGPDHPARFALVEVENIYDEGLVFEPIHRVLFNIKGDILAAMKAYYTEKGSGEVVEFRKCKSKVEMINLVTATRPKSPSPTTHRIGMILEGGFGMLEISNPTANLPVGTLQPFIDNFLTRGFALKIDYVHGEDVVCKLGGQPGNLGFYLPAMDKSDLFKTVILDGVLPRKTFSMGEAHEKRFYLESRKIE